MSLLPCFLPPQAVYRRGHSGETPVAFSPYESARQLCHCSLPTPSHLCHMLPLPASRVHLEIAVFSRPCSRHVFLCDIGGDAAVLRGADIPQVRQEEAFRTAGTGAAHVVTPHTRYTHTSAHLYTFFTAMHHQSANTFIPVFIFLCRRLAFQNPFLENSKEDCDLLQISFLSPSHHRCRFRVAATGCCQASRSRLLWKRCPTTVTWPGTEDTIFKARNTSLWFLGRNTVELLLWYPWDTQWLCECSLWSLCVKVVCYRCLCVKAVCYRCLCVNAFERISQSHRSTRQVNIFEHWKVFEEKVYYLVICPIHQELEHTAKNVGRCLPLISVNTVWCIVVTSSRVSLLCAALSVTSQKSAVCCIADCNDVDLRNNVPECISKSLVKVVHSVLHKNMLPYGGRASCRSTCHSVN